MGNECCEEPEDLQIKQDIIQDLLVVTAILQEQLHNQHQAFWRQHISSLQGELNLLRDELYGMINGRISYREIPSERVSCLANTIYFLCKRNLNLPSTNQVDSDK